MRSSTSKRAHLSTTLCALVVLGGLAALTGLSACESDETGETPPPALLDGGGGRGDSGSLDDAGLDAAGPEDDGGSVDDAGDDSGSLDDAGDDAAAPPPLALTSTAFANGTAIPASHTCNGVNVSPPLAWVNAPAGTQSYAVVMRDLTLGGTGNYHWVIYDIPAATTSLAQGVQNTAAPATPAGAKQTAWSFGALLGYGGPCPPMNEHDYEFRVYTFATATLTITAGATAVAADAVIQANKTAEASLTGTYQQP